METLTRGDVVLFPFPYTDLSNRKLRPCLVLSEEMGDDVMLCQITSQRLRKDDYSIELRQADTSEVTLMIDSYNETPKFLIQLLGVSNITESRKILKI